MVITLLINKPIQQSFYGFLVDTIDEGGYLQNRIKMKGLPCNLIQKSPFQAYARCSWQLNIAGSFEVLYIIIHKLH